MSKILGVGIATLDIINEVNHYPAEDEEMRAGAQQIARGGNCANTLDVLSQLGHDCHLCATLADDPDSGRIKASLMRQGVATALCQHIEGGHAPTSYITRNRQNGSRTIVHYRDLPELEADHFCQLPIGDFDWFHFEGRNPLEVVRMLEYVQAQRSEQPISIEVEKERPDIDALYAFADVLIFSRNFVMGRNHDSAEEFLRIMRAHAPRALLVCPWAEDGAWLLDHNDQLHHAAAQPPEQIVDTLGAGDSFNAGLIHALATGSSATEALAEANQVAGRKIGQIGFAQLFGGQS
jgi:ketohexokinase